MHFTDDLIVAPIYCVGHPRNTVKISVFYHVILPIYRIVFPVIDIILPARVNSWNRLIVAIIVQ